MPTGPSPARLRIFRWLAAGLSTIIGLVILFIGLRFRDAVQPVYLQEPGYERTGHRYLYDELLGWRNIPDWEATTNGKPLTINSHGLRDRMTPFEKPHGTRRILLLGDSFVWGYGVGDDQIFTEILERRLADHHSHWEVLNTGVSGWGTDQQYLFLREEGWRYAPDLVILAFFARNDVHDISTSRRYGNNKPLFLDHSLHLANVPVPGPFTEVEPLLTNVPPVDLALTIMARIAADCRREGTAFLVMKFGRVGVDPPKDWYLPDVEQPFLEQFPLRVGVPLLDLDAEFTARQVPTDDLFRDNDDGHWNAYGHQLVAEILHEFLLTQGLLE